MEDVLGYLKIRVKRGINLARRDVYSSDPYVVVMMGQQRLKTRTVRKNCNPEWNQDLMLSIKDPNEPVFLKVYDKDMFSSHDEMGEAVINMKPFLDAVKNGSPEPPVGTHMKTLCPNRDNYLAKQSIIKVSEGGKITQEMRVRLGNVESGEIELEMEWVNAPGFRGFCRGRFSGGFHSAARLMQMTPSNSNSDAHVYA